ncbi:MAG: cob(I)yrinic acid a,c-diamide adenosyltransferase [Myxococcales bacterium]|nr:cob(I)yrinic acid a,c-diamide adenosyltransferase [Myxococcales bacterium]MCB9530220.1 cob(I)yrinic acid a,c-diamide adenosyltransferase [Myxococcales bacterium]MCB9533733.1 cob(I)yrinic acid a,c-diamide adenosyltransferase [Myxococcales bacterium]
MTDGTFDDPKRVAINRVYTRTGDDGGTRLVGGQQVPKDSSRIAAYGEVDELNAFVGVARDTLERGEEAARDLANTLERVQHQLFNLGSILATLPEDVHPRQPRVTDADVAWLEAEMDRRNAGLPVLRSFVLPGGSRANAELHVCRTVCRRVERTAVALSRSEHVDAETIRYLNRLSDAFFVWSRWVIAAVGGEESLWRPNAATGE